MMDRWLGDSPSWGRDLGLHQYDGKVGDYSRAAFDARLAGARRDLAELAPIDPASLDDDDAIDLAILKQYAAQLVFSLGARDLSRTSLEPYQDIFDVEGYVDRDYAPAAARLQKLVEHEEAALLQAPHIRENVKLPLAKVFARVGAKNFAGFADYLRTDVIRTFSKVGDVALQARFMKSNEALASQAEAIGDWLKEKVEPTGDDSFRLGKDRFADLLASQEGLTMPLQEFKKMAEVDLAKNKASYNALINTTKLTPILPSDELGDATKIVADARKFVVQHGVVTLASEDDALVKQMPQFARWNAAALSQSGPFDPFHVAYYEITLPDPRWPKSEQLAYALPFGTLVATSVHEVYPGHFVQGRWRDRAPTRLQKIDWSYSFGEGWAHYVEQMMVEEGFYADRPETKLGQVADALLRDCRFLGSIALHVEGRTIEEVSKMFTDECHQDPATSREQAERGTFDPGYFAYTLGKLQILALREEAKKLLGERFSLRAFHDELLSHGTPPVALMHDRVLRDLAASTK